MRRALLLLPLAALAAGCGGGSKSGLGGGAQFVPPNTVAFVAARADSNWRPFARQVLGRIPQVPKNADEVDIAVLQGGKVVVLARTGKTWSGRPLGRSLADSAHYLASLRVLPDDTVARAYVRGDVTGKRLLSIPGQITTTVANFGAKFRVIKHPTTQVSIAFLKYSWGAAWLTTHGAGARAHVNGLPLAESNRVRTIQTVASGYAPGLFDEIPADALRVLDLYLPQSAFELMPKLPGLIARRFPHAGFELRGQLDDMLGGETAIYTRRGGEVTLVTSPADLTAAERVVGELLTGPAIHRASIGGQLVISTKASGIAAFRGGGPKLSADEAFRKAGFPEQLTLLAYERGKTAAWATSESGDPTFTARFSGSGS